MSNDSINPKCLESRKIYKQTLKQHKNTVWAKYHIRYQLLKNLRN